MRYDIWHHGTAMEEPLAVVADAGRAGALVAHRAKGLQAGVAGSLLFTPHGNKRPIFYAEAEARRGEVTSFIRVLRRCKTEILPHIRQDGIVNAAQQLNVEQGDRLRVYEELAEGFLTDDACLLQALKTAEVSGYEMSLLSAVVLVRSMPRGTFSFRWICLYAGDLYQPALEESPR